jgi:regulatory protein
VTTARRAAGRPAIALDSTEARRVAIDLLARKSWTERELARRLEQRGAPEEVAQAVVADLRSRGYLDDAAFARWWAQARAQGRRVGSARLRRELLGKGIAPDLVATALSAAFETASELDRATEAGRKRLAALGRSGRDAVPNRLHDYLLRRGYPSSVVRRVVKALLAIDLGEGPAAADEASV